MGNKHSNGSHDTTLDDGAIPRRRDKSTSKSARKKNALSCPNLDVTTGEGKTDGAAQPRSKTDEEAEVKILRSFSSTQDILRGSTMISPEPEVDIKVYRRSTATLSRVQSSGGSRSATLPRNMGRSRSINTGGFQSVAGGSVSGEGTGTMPYEGRKRTSSIEQRGASTMARKKLNTTAESVELGLDVTAVKKNLSEFEKQFVRHLTDLYADLSEFIQLSALAIAVGPLPTSCHPVSLWEYLNSERLPLDLLEPSSPDDDGNSTAEYRLTIPTPMFHGVMHIRRSGVAGQAEKISLAQELFMCLAVEVSGELSRMFEYQIGLLAGPTVVDLLAKHAADCAMEYLKTNNRFMDLNTVVHGVVHGTIHISPDQQKIISVIVGEREFKWLLEDIFKKPGLMRKKTIGVTTEAEILRLPWRFFTNENADPGNYGYRTVMVERYYASGSCRPSVDDEAMFNEEVDWANDDIHRRYRPTRVGRLVDSNQNVELSSAWKVENVPRKPGDGVPQYTICVDREPPHSIQSPLYVPSTIAQEETVLPPTITVQRDVENGVEIRKKNHDNYVPDNGAVIRSKLSDDYERHSGTVEVRTSKSRSSETDGGPEVRQYSPIGEDGKCKTYRPRSALSGRISESDTDGRNKSYRPQSALSGHITDQESDGQLKTYRPKSALSGRISEIDADDRRNDEKKENVSRMPDLLLYSTPKTELIQQQQYRNSEVPYARPVELENEFNRSSTLPTCVDNRASLQEGPIMVRPGPQPVCRSPSGKVPPQPPVRKTPYVGEQRSPTASSPGPVEMHSEMTEAPVRPSHFILEQRNVPEIFPEAMVTSSPIAARAPERTLPYVRDQRIVSEIFTENVEFSPVESRNTSTLRGMSMISPVSSEQSYVVPGRPAAKPVIRNPKPVVNPVMTSSQRSARGVPPPVAPKKKTASVSLASPEIITPPVVEQAPRQDFMNFNDFLNVVRINEESTAERPANQSATRKSFISDISCTTANQNSLITTANQNSSIQVSINVAPVQADGTFLDFNNFLHILHDPSRISTDEAPHARESSARTVGFHDNGNHDRDLSVNGGRSVSFVPDPSPHAVHQVQDHQVPGYQVHGQFFGLPPTGYPISTAVTCDMTVQGGYHVVYRDAVDNQTSPALVTDDRTVPGVLVSDL